MMPLFIYYFGATLDTLGEPVEPGAEQRTFVDLVAPLCIRFGVIGLVAAVAGFTMVTLWTISGERQVRYSLTVPSLSLTAPLTVPLSSPLFQEGTAKVVGADIGDGSSVVGLVLQKSSPLGFPAF